MKKCILFLILLQCRTFSLTIVAKINPKDNSFYLEDNDPDRKEIIDILYRYQWPVSLVELSDAERQEIFRDKVPFAETVFIKNKIREIAKSDKYCVFWIPSMLSQSCMLYLKKKKEFDGDFLNEKIFPRLNLLGYNLYGKQPNFSKQIVTPTFMVEKNPEEKKKWVDKLFKNINGSLLEKDMQGIEFMWLYYCKLVKILNEKKCFPSLDQRLDISKEKAVELSVEFITSFFGDDKIYYRTVSGRDAAIKNIVTQAIEMEYKGARENRAFFSREAPVLKLSFEDINRFTAQAIKTNKVEKDND